MDTGSDSMDVRLLGRLALLPSALPEHLSDIDSRCRHVSFAFLRIVVGRLHVYEAVRLNFEVWLQKLSNARVTPLHDVNVRQKEFGVWRFWKKLIERRPRFALSRSRGLGVLAVGSKLPGVFHPLFVVSVGEGEWAQTVFPDLGGRVRAQDQIQEQDIRWQDL